MITKAMTTPGKDRKRRGRNGVRLLRLLFLSPSSYWVLYGQTEMKRNRGESFYTTQSSNTEGGGNIWLTAGGVGHVWDDMPIKTTDTKPGSTSGFWVSNARAFPEVNLQGGLTSISAC
jgi:hypothetical protein